MNRWEKELPTPWVADPRAFRVEATNGRTVACSAAMLPYQAQEAVQHLLAAAPDLRAALAAMLADAETLREPWRNEALCKAARAALAKAEGRED